MSREAEAVDIAILIGNALLDTSEPIEPTLDGHGELAISVGDDSATITIEDWRMAEGPMPIQYRVTVRRAE